MKRFLALGAVLTTAAFSLFGVAPAAGGAPLPGGLPIIRDQGATAGRAAGLPTTSINWSGYAVTAQAPFTDVSATWVQPAITCSGNEKYVITSNWVGLDGFTDQTVEQDGTDAKCFAASDTPKYQAWYEMYPAGSVNVFGVQPGDTISASVISGFANNYPIEGVYNLNDTEKIGPKGFISVDTVSNVNSTNSFTATWDRSGKPTPIKL